MSPLGPGAQVHGRYALVRRLGSGGMADVWLADDSQLGRQVALKVLHERFARDAEFVERFRREASSAAGLQHPNVIGIFDRGEVDGTYYIAMEYVEGPSLKDLIASGLELDEAVEITRQLLAAARFAHERGIVHRDLKPANVLVDREGRARVADFGIAQAGVSDITQTGSVMGTAEYLSPEQAQGRPVTAASDLYSIGVMLYEMLCGRVPFEGDNAVAVAMKHVNERPLPPSARDGRVPHALDQVTLRAMAKEPANRFASAEEFRAALDTAAANPDAVLGDTAARMPAAVVYPDEGPATGEERLAGERRRWPWLLAITLLLAAAIVAFALLTSADQVLVPGVSGESQDRAVRVLERAGFEVEIDEVERTQRRGTVVDQIPAGGVEADEGSTVTLLVSVGPGMATIPSVRGMSEEEATEELEDAGFEVAVRQRPSSLVRAGQAIGTRPAANQSAQRGSTVRLLVSTGPETEIVPSVVGLDRGEAQTVLREAGFIPNVETEESDAAENTVVSQDPDAGAEIETGQEVTIVVSTGPGTITVPDVTGDPERAARRELERAGFEVRVTREFVDDESEDGIVLDQLPEAGSELEEGDTVTITVGDFVAPEPGDDDGDNQ